MYLIYTIKNTLANNAKIKTRRCYQNIKLQKIKIKNVKWERGYTFCGSLHKVSIISKSKM